MSPYFYILNRRAAPEHPRFAKRPPPALVLAAGHVARLLIGQCHGFIRLADGREVYFHRADMGKDGSFNRLRVGDSVTFELLDDRVSGARAQRVIRHQRRG